MKTKYPEYKIGDKFKCLETIYFSDGTKHTKGQIYTATEETKAYFEVNHTDYKKVN